MIFYQPKILDGVYELDPEESKHCFKVLRKKVGDRITVVDGFGTYYEVELLSVNIKSCTFKSISSTKEDLSKYAIHIAVAPTKSMDRLEWFVEKAVEIGINEITFLECQNSERIYLKLDRLRKKAVSAMKQSQRATLPVLNDKIKFSEFINKESLSSAEHFIAYVDGENTSYLKNLISGNKNVCILIGPEGDFSKSEIELAKSKSFEPVSLGKHRLRTETAALAACHIAGLKTY